MINRRYIIFLSAFYMLLLMLLLLLHRSLLYRSTRPLLRDFREATPQPSRVMYCVYTCLIASNIILYSPPRVLFLSLSISGRLRENMMVNRSRSKMHENFWNICENFRSHGGNVNAKKKKKRTQRAHIYTPHATESKLRPDITHEFNDPFQRHRRRGNKPLLTLYRWCYYIFVPGPEFTYFVYVRNVCFVCALLHTCCTQCNKTTAFHCVRTRKTHIVSNEYEK